MSTVQREARLEWAWESKDAPVVLTPTGIESRADCDLILAAIDRYRATVVALKATLPEDPIDPPIDTTETPLQVTPLALSGTVKKGQKTSFDLTLKKGGDDVHSWEPKSNAGWLTTIPVYGSLRMISTETDTLKVNVDTNADMILGVNNGLVYIWDTYPGQYSKLLSIPVTITVTP